MKTAHQLLLKSSFSSNDRLPSSSGKDANLFFAALKNFSDVSWPISEGNVVNLLQKDSQLNSEHHRFFPMANPYSRNVYVRILCTSLCVQLCVCVCVSRIYIKSIIALLRFIRERRGVKDTDRLLSRTSTDKWFSVTRLCQFMVPSFSPLLLRRILYMPTKARHEIF